MLMENMIIDLCQIGKWNKICYINKISNFNWFLIKFVFRRDEIIEVLKHRYAEKMNQNLPIFGIDKANLKDFTTTEKDFKKGQNRFPPA